MNEQICISEEKKNNPFYLVEATYQEQQNLWASNKQAGNLGLVKPHYDVNWKSDSMGSTLAIGYLDKRPVAVALFWAEINGKVICFYEATSQVVDWEMIDKWRKKKFADVPKTNAANFHLCIQAINFANKTEAKWKLISKYTYSHIETGEVLSEAELWRRVNL